MFGGDAADVVSVLFRLWLKLSFIARIGWDLMSLDSSATLRSRVMIGFAKEVCRS